MVEHGFFVGYDAFFGNNVGFEHRLSTKRGKNSCSGSGSSAVSKDHGFFAAYGNSGFFKNDEESILLARRCIEREFDIV